MTITIKARPEEVGIGATLGAGLGLACASVISVGMPSLIPSLSAGAWGFTQSSLAAALSLAGAIAGGVIAARQEMDSHIGDGAQYFPDHDRAVRELQVSMTGEFSQAQKQGTVHGFRIGNLELSRDAETTHALLVGLPRGGKTVHLNSVADQAIARGDKVLILAVKTDFIERYYRPDEPNYCVLLGPWEARSHMWDASADLGTTALTGQFASDLLRAANGGKEPTGNEAFFSNGAATLLGGLLRSYLARGERWTWSDVRRAVQAPDALGLVLRAAEGDPDGIKMMFPNAFAAEPFIGKTETNFVQSAGNALKSWVLTYAAVEAARPEAPKFSIKGWLNGTAHNDTRIVILNYRDEYREGGRGLFGSMLRAISATVKSMPDIAADAPGITAIFDESPQIGSVALNEIEGLCSVGRSKGMRVWLGLQDLSQIRAIMGSESAAPVLQMPVLKVYARCDAKTAHEISHDTGTHMVGRITNTAQGGAVSGKTKTTQEVPVLEAGALTGLKKLPEGVELIVRYGDKLGRIVQPFPTRTPDNHAPGYVACEAWERGTLPEYHRAIPEDKFSLSPSARPQVSGATSDDHESDGPDEPDVDDFIDM